MQYLWQQKLLEKLDDDFSEDRSDEVVHEG